MLDRLLEDLKGFLERKIEELEVVVMPDFFLDRLISLKSDVKVFSEMLGRIVERKGGCMDRIEQVDFRGGNAVNTAAALAALGVKTTAIVCTSKLGFKLMKFYLNSSKVNLSHVKFLGNASITTSIELKIEDGKANVMLRDVGALDEFGSHHLNEKDFEVMENADYVCVFNWAGTRQFGTELAETVFRRVKDKGKGKTYYDTADPTTNEAKIPKLMKKVFQPGYIDILSVNESEAIYYASQLSSEVNGPGKPSKIEELAKESGRILASHIPSRVDLHTTSFSASFRKDCEVLVPTFKVPVLRTTGAGDAWNAGNILGDAHELSDEHRLALANAVAAYYISDREGRHPTQEQLSEFCSRLRKKST